MKNKKMGTMVQVDTNMSQEMMEALTEFEFSCIVPQKDICTIEEVQSFLNVLDPSGELSADFNPKMMFNPPAHH